MSTRSYRIITALFVLGLPEIVFAQGAQLELVREAGLFCPAGGAQTTVGFLNRTGVPQTIPAGTRMQLVFSFPVSQVPVYPDGVSFSYSANTLKAAFQTSFTVENGYGIFFNSVSLNLQAATERAPIAVTVIADPASVVFTQSNTAILGMADPSACQPAPQSAFTIEDLTSICPTAAEVATFRAALDLRLDSDPSAGTLVCRAADGSADLTRLEERTFQAYRLMEFLPFDAPLPWTSKSLYDWFTSAIRGIRYRSDIPYSFCCDPAGYINIQTSVGVLQFPTDPAVVISLADLLSHEARHNEGFPHTCGTWDQTLTETGAWGVVFYYNEWAAFRTGDFLKSKIQGRSAYYRSWAWSSGQSVLTSAICDHAGGAVVSPAAADFGQQTVGFAGPPRSLAITQTEGGPISAVAVSVEGANAAEFAVTSTPCSGKTLPPSCAVVIRFTPGTAGPRSAQLKVTFEGSEIQRTVNLTGIGVTGSVCNYALSSNAQSVAGNGGFGTVSIATASGCNWEAVSSAPWIRIASGSEGAGNGTLAFVAAPNSDPVPRTGRLTIAGQTFSVNQAAPVTAISGVISASGYGAMPFFAAGSWLEITGTGLAFSTMEWQASDFIGDNAPTSLDSVRVSINGLPGFIYYIKPDDEFGPSQVNVQAPADPTIGSVPITVSNAAGASRTFIAQKTAIAPGMLAPPNFKVGGPQYLVATYAGEYVFVGKPGLIAGAPFRPAKPKDIIWVYGIGFGDVTPPVAPGVIARQATRLNAQVSFQFGPMTVTPSYAGLHPGYVGLYLFSLEVPDVPDGDQPIAITVNGQPVLQSLYLTVKR